MVPTKRKPFLSKIAKAKDLIVVKDVFDDFYNQGHIFVLQTPNRRVVSISVEDCPESFSGNFYLSFPHVLFRIQYAKYAKARDKFFKPMNLWVAFTNGPDLKKLFVPPLMNIDHDMKVCIPHPQRGRSLKTLVKSWIDAFWKTQFNDGMADAINDYYCDGSYYYDADLVGLADPREWQKRTKKSPNWVPNGRSLVEFDKQNFLDVERDHSEEYDDDEGY